MTRFLLCAAAVTLLAAASGKAVAVATYQQEEEEDSDEPLCHWVEGMSQEESEEFVRCADEVIDDPPCDIRVLWGFAMDAEGRFYLTEVKIVCGDPID